VTDEERRLRHNESNRRWREANPDHDRAYRMEHPRKPEYYRQWRADHPGRAAEAARRYRERKAMEKDG
jgi:hypothetical protein